MDWKQELEALVVCMAQENRSWGYDRIVGALANLGYTIAVARSSVSRVHNLLFPTWVCKFGMVAVAMMLLAGCGDGGGGGHRPDDDFDFIVSFLSPLEIAIRRPFSSPFRLLEIGVTPFGDPILGPLEPYVLEVSGIALFDGTEIIFAVTDFARTAFIDPLGERVVDVFIVCDCFVDYVILRSPVGETTIVFN